MHLVCIGTHQDDSDQTSPAAESESEPSVQAIVNHSPPQRSGQRAPQRAAAIRSPGWHVQSESWARAGPASTRTSERGGDTPAARGGQGGDSEGLAGPGQGGDSEGLAGPGPGQSLRFSTRVAEGANLPGHSASSESSPPSERSVGPARPFGPARG
jgi:hypothetical protein